MVGDDTNPLIGMLPCQIHKLNPRPEPKQGGNHSPKCWSIALLRITVGSEVYRNVSFMHPVQYPPVQYFGNSRLVFNDLNSSKADVISTGDDALVAFYKSKPS